MNKSERRRLTFDTKEQKERRFFSKVRILPVVALQVVRIRLLNKVVNVGIAKKNLQAGQSKS